MQKVLGFFIANQYRYTSKLSVAVFFRDRLNQQSKIVAEVQIFTIFFGALGAEGVLKR